MMRTFPGSGERIRTSGLWVMSPIQTKKYISILLKYNLLQRLNFKLFLTSPPKYTLLPYLIPYLVLK